MSCNNTENLTILLFDELNDQDTQQLKQHLESCPSCQLEYKQLQDSITLVEAGLSIDKPVLSDDRREAILAEVANSAKPSTLFPKVIWKVIPIAALITIGLFVMMPKDKIINHKELSYSKTMKEKLKIQEALVKNDKAVIDDSPVIAVDSFMDDDISSDDNKDFKRENKQADIKSIVKNSYSKLNGAGTPTIRRLPTEKGQVNSIVPRSRNIIRKSSNSSEAKDNTSKDASRMQAHIPANEVVMFVNRSPMQVIAKEDGVSKKLKTNFLMGSKKLFVGKKSMTSSIITTFIKEMVKKDEPTTANISAKFAKSPFHKNRGLLKIANSAKLQKQNIHIKFNENRVVSYHSIYNDKNNSYYELKLAPTIGDKVFCSITIQDKGQKVVVDDKLVKLRTPQSDPIFFLILSAAEFANQQKYPNDKLNTISIHGFVQKNIKNSQAKKALLSLLK